MQTVKECWNLSWGPAPALYDIDLPESLAYITVLTLIALCFNGTMDQILGHPEDTFPGVEAPKSSSKFSRRTTAIYWRATLYNHDNEAVKDEGTTHCEKRQR